MTTDLLLEVAGVVHVAQAALLQARGHLQDVAAHVLEQLLVAVARPQPWGLAHQVEGMEDVLGPGERGNRWGRRGEPR